MRTLITVLSIFCLCTYAAAQGRAIDLASKIVDPQEGDSFVSPTKKIVSVYLYNLGPDTIIPKDEYSVKFIFSAFHIFPQFKKFNTTLYPGDSFLYQRELDINYSGDVEQMKFCTEAFSFSNGRDSIKRETGDARINNKHCITTKHIDSSMTSSIGENATHVVTIWPNPASDYLTIESSDVIEYVKVFSSTGAHLISLSNGPSQHVIFDTQSFLSGVYFFAIKTSKGSYMEKVIILE